MSMAALRQEQSQAKSVQGKGSTAGKNGLATPPALGGSGPIRGWRTMAAINRLFAGSGADRGERQQGDRRGRRLAITRA